MKTVISGSQNTNVMPYSTMGASDGVVWIWFIMKKERSELEPWNKRNIKKDYSERFKSGRWFGERVAYLK